MLNLSMFLLRQSSNFVSNLKNYPFELNLFPYVAVIYLVAEIHIANSLEIIQILIIYSYPLLLNHSNYRYHSIHNFYHYFVCFFFSINLCPMS